MDIAIIIWVISIIVGVSVGSKKGEGCVSFIFCFILGPFWLPVVFLSKGNRRQCDNCKELIHEDATICPHCRSEVMIYKVEKKKFDKFDPLNVLVIAVLIGIIIIIIFNSGR